MQFEKSKIVWNLSMLSMFSFLSNNVVKGRNILIIDNLIGRTNITSIPSMGVIIYCKFNFCFRVNTD